jgi:hypothetical protein
MRWYNRVADQSWKEHPCHLEPSFRLLQLLFLVWRASRLTPSHTAPYTAGAVFAWEASTAEAPIAELTCAVAWAWAWVPLPSVQQWQPRIITAGPSADITLTRPAIRFSGSDLPV